MPTTPIPKPNDPEFPPDMPPDVPPDLPEPPTEEIPWPFDLYSDAGAKSRHRHTTTS